MKSLFLSVCLLLLALPVQSDEGEGLQDALQQEHERADQKEMQVRKLTERAGKISTALSDIEDDIRTLKSKVGAQEKILKEIRDNELKARKEHFALEKEKNRIQSELAGLMSSLWPVHLQNVRARFVGVDSWDMFDRRFNWLADIYDATHVKLDEARTNSERIARNLERQQLLEKEAEQQLAMVNSSKDRLLGSKHALRKNLRKVRQQQKSIEAELTEILSTIQGLKYQLQSQKTKRFAMYKRTLPWPVSGRLAAGFDPSGKPPVRGVAIETGVGAMVQSVFWGKVVHNDTLRGFGHVVIVYHGFDYYSLYAYLAETMVRTGQEVEKNEPLGTAGFYPMLDAPGLYFELRFHQKPINPSLWLTSLN